MFQGSPPDPRLAYPAQRDARWHALSLVQNAREALGLRAGDIAVLRGLLSLITPEGFLSGGNILVYAANKTLIERCDGLDERTLRRRLAKLIEVGLIQRRLSPNRKRYVIRDESGEVAVGYGFELSPLRARMAELVTLGEEVQREATRLKALRAQLRDRLWKLADGNVDNPLAGYEGLLRNKVSAQEVQAALAALPQETATTEEIPSVTTKLTDSDSNFDRDIQSSNKESLRKNAEKLDLSSVITLVPDALEYSPTPIRSWRDLSALSRTLGPALAIDRKQLDAFSEIAGEDATSLAVLGILQAGAKVRNPSSYFASLLTKAKDSGLNLEAMFKSLVRTPKRTSLGFRPETC